MQIRFPIQFLFILALGPAAPNAFAQKDTDKPATVTMAKALKLGPEKLTELTDPSEAGQDQAAQFYALAKRIETEHALAQKDLAQVGLLQEWRLALSNCRTGACLLAASVNGGGTMYSHGANRDAAEVEDFLAGMAGRLPLAEGKGDPAAVKQMDEAIALIKGLKLSDTEADKETKTAFAAEIKENIGHWESLKFMVSELPSAEAKKIASFAASSLSWLKE